MAKRKVVAEIFSYGIYTRWEAGSKQLPKITAITTQIPIVPDMEFGYVLKIQGAKGKVLSYCIEHPPMVDGTGTKMPSFEGECFVDSNNYEFFLGDTVWAPFEQMVGVWLLTVWCDAKILSQKRFALFLPE